MKKGKFHNYSFNNTLLTAMQKPDATLVAGFNAWQKNLNRRVNKGERGIRILAPAPYKIKEEREKLDPVTGEPSPKLEAHEFLSTVEGYEDFIKGITYVVPVPAGFEDIPGESKGYFSLTDKRIAVQEGMSESQTLKTSYMKRHIPCCMTGK